MKSKIILFQLILTFIISVLLFIAGFEMFFVYSVFISSFLSCINLVALIWGYEQVFFKKSVALGISVIVSKWLILILVLYKLLKMQGVDGKAVGLGISLFFPVLVVVSYLVHKQRNKKQTD